jgi:hypothetical protein
VPATAFYDRLTNQNIYYWLTDSKGRPVTSYTKGDGVDTFPIFESSAYALDPLPTREHPAPISLLIGLNQFRLDVVIHLAYTNSEETISLRKSRLEPYDGFDVLYIK